MHCPHCQTPDTKVIDSRLSAEGLQVRRRRTCNSCGERFTTFETVELSLPRVVKHNGNRESFDLQKIRVGMARALEKRPVTQEQLDDAVARIGNLAQRQGERELAVASIGEWVMDELRSLDQVAYVRFASVYRSFQDVSEFRTEVDRLQEQDDPL